MSERSIRIHEGRPPQNLLDGSHDLTSRFTWAVACAMPACSIRTSLVLQEWLFALKESEADPCKVHAELPGGQWATDLISLSQAIAILEELSERFESEAMVSSEVGSMLRAVEANLRGGRLSEAYNGACQVTSKYAMPFNFRVSTSLIQASTQQLDGFRLKDVIQVLGTTGAGKTSLMLFLCQAMFVAGPGGRPMPSPDCPVATRLKHLKVGLGASSETTYVSTVQLNMADVPDPEEELPAKAKEMELFLGDSAGYHETRGVELAVANEISVVEALKQTRSVRLVFVLPKMSVGSKFENVPELLSTLVGIAPDIDQHLSSVRFVWTGFPRSDLVGRDALVPRFVRLLLDTPPKEYENNEAVMSLLEEADRQINQHPTRAEAMGLDLHDHMAGGKATDTDEVRASLLSYLIGSGRRARPLTDPAAVFKTSLSASVTVKVQLQLDIFTQLLRHKVGLFPAYEGVALVRYILGELQQTAENIPLAIIRERLELCRRIVTSKLESVTEDAVVHIQRVCQPPEHMAETDVREVQAVVDFMCRVEEDLRGTLGGDAPPTNAARLQQALQHGCEEIAGAVEEAMKVDQVDSRALRKLGTLAQVSPGLSAVCDSVLFGYLSRLDDVLIPELDASLKEVHSGDLSATAALPPTRADAETLLESQGPAEQASTVRFTIAHILQLADGIDCVNTMVAEGPAAECDAGRDVDVLKVRQVEEGGEKMSDAIVMPARERYKEKCATILTHHLAAIKTSVTGAISSDMPLSSHRCEKFQREAGFLHAMSLMRPLESFSVAETAWSDVLASVARMFATAKEEIAVLFQPQLDLSASGCLGTEQFAMMELIVARVCAVCRQQSAIKAQTSEAWSALVGSLSGYLRDTKMEVERNLNRFLAGDSDVNFDQLSAGLEALGQAQWMDVYQPGLVDRVVVQAKKEVVRAMSNKAQGIKSLHVGDRFSSGAQEQLEGANEVLQIFRETEALEDSIDGLESLRNDFEEWYARTVRTSLQVAFTLFSEEPHSVAAAAGIADEYDEEAARLASEAEHNALETLRKAKPSPFTTAGEARSKLNAVTEEAAQLDIRLDDESKSLEATRTEDYLPLKKIHASACELRDQKKSKPLRKLLSTRGYVDLPDLERQYQEAEASVAEKESLVRDLEVVQRRLHLEARQIEQLLAEYTAHRETSLAQAAESTRQWLQRRAHDHGLRLNGTGKAAAEAAVAQLQLHLLEFSDEDTLKWRQGRPALDIFDERTANDVSEFLRVCEGLNLCFTASGNLPQLLKVVRHSFDTLVAARVKQLIHCVTRAIGKAHAFNHLKKLEVEEWAKSAHDANAAQPHPDSPDTFAAELRLAFASVERVARDYPSLFAAFQKVPGLTDSSIQTQLNVALVALYNRLQEDMLQYFTNGELGEHRALVDVAQALASACDARFKHFEPRPLPSHDGNGTFAALYFSRLRQESDDIRSVMTSAKNLFPEDRPVNDDVVHEAVLRVKNAGGSGASKAFRQLMQLYERSLGHEMKDMLAKLRFMAAGDQDMPDKLQKLQKLLNRLETVCIQFQDDWLPGSASSMPHEIEKWVKQAKDVVAEKLFEWLRRSSRLAEEQYFARAQTQWFLGKKGIEALGNYADGLQHHCNSGEATDLRQYLEEVNNNIASSLAGAVAVYQELPLSEYAAKPPKELFRRISEAGDDLSALSTERKLQEAIISKFKASMEQVLESGDLDSSLLDDAEVALDGLTDELKGKVKDTIRRTKRELEKQTKNAANAASDIIGNGNFDVQELLEWCQKQEGKPHSRAGLDPVRKHVRARAEEHRSRTRESLWNHDTSTIVRDVGVVLKWEKLEPFVPTLRSIREEITTTVKKAMQRWLNRLVDLLTQYQDALNSNPALLAGQPVTAHRIIRAVTQLLPLYHTIGVGEAKNASSAGESVAASADDHVPEQLPYSLEPFQRFEDAFVKCGEEATRLLSQGIAETDCRLISAAMSIVMALDQRETDTNEMPVDLATSIAEYADRRQGMPPVAPQMVQVAKQLRFAAHQAEVLAWLARSASVVQEAELQEHKDAVGLQSSNQSRLAYFDTIKKALECVTIVGPSLEFLSSTDSARVRDQATECKQMFVTKVHDLYRAAIRRAGPDGNPDRQQLQQLGHWMDNLVVIKDAFQSTVGAGASRAPGDEGVMIDILTETLRASCSARLRQVQPMVAAGDYAGAVTCLVEVKAVSENIRVLRRPICNSIDAELRMVKQQKGTGTTNIEQLHLLLETNQDPLGPSMVAEHKAFAGGRVIRFNERCNGVDYILSSLVAEPPTLDKDALKRAHDTVMQDWKAAVKGNLRPNCDLAEMASEVLKKIHAIANRMGAVDQRNGALVWRKKQRDAVPSLLGNLFALWTLCNSEHYFDAAGMDAATRDKYLMAPHAGQVLSLLRLFGTGFAEGQEKRSLENQLVQLKTGEGKSVVIAVAACVLALLGCDVSCACYSSTLSSRDAASFAQVFDLIGVGERIHYGTFDQLCESVINEHGQIRKAVKNLIENGTPARREQTQAHKRVFIADEVDTFFSLDFYGQVYVPAATLTDATISALVMLIWAKRDSNLTWKDLEKTAEYKACVSRFSDWFKLIKEAACDMLTDVKRFDAVKYVVKHDKIAYQQLDGLVYDKAYRYSTMFAYCYECEVTGAISAESRDRHLGVTVRCGNFSFSEVPAAFSCIMGVTATLDSLSQQKSDILQAPPFSVAHKLYTTSVFSTLPLIFSPQSEATRDLFIVKRAVFAVSLYEQIEQRRCPPGDIGPDGRTTRAVLVFFKDEEKLRAALECAQPHLRGSIALLTADLSDEEKLDRVRQATFAHAITFATAEFGRGTDFICRDNRVLKAGGVHVIQTFVASSLSLAVQIRGRTGRQGQPGSYSLLLVEEELETVGVKLEGVLAQPFEPVAVPEMPETYGEQVSSGALGKRLQYIGRCRDAAYDANYKEQTTHVAELVQEHQLAKSFLASLYDNNMEAVRAFLEARNQGAPADVQSRTIVMMDATGSMSSLLQKAKNTVRVVYDRLCEILVEHNHNTRVFEIQFGVYRNYNSPHERILQVSPWSSQPDDLQDFMDSISPEGGWGREAVEVGLWHCRQEIQRTPKVTQVLLIGDAPANTPDEVASKRASNHWKQWVTGRKPKDYWSQDPRFANPTTSDAELAEIKKLGVPVHAYWVGAEDGWEKGYFQEVAARTGGHSGFLDVSAEDGKEMLTNTLSVSVLETLDSSGNLVKAYNKKYGSAARV